MIISESFAKEIKEKKGGIVRVRYDDTSDITISFKLDVVKDENTTVHLKFSLNHDETLHSLASKIAKEVGTVKTLKFLFRKMTWIPLSEDIKDVLSSISDDDEKILMYLNGVKYFLDLNNGYKVKGNQYYKSENFEKAIRCYKKSLVFFPHAKITHLNIAQCYYKLEKPKTAIRCTLKFVEEFNAFKTAYDLQEDHTAVQKANMKVMQKAREMKTNMRLGKLYYMIARKYLSCVDFSDAELYCTTLTDLDYKIDYLDEDADIVNEDEFDVHKNDTTWKGHDKYLLCVAFACLTRCIRHFCDVKPRQLFLGFRSCMGMFDAAINEFCFFKKQPPCCIFCRKFEPVLKPVKLTPDLLLKRMAVNASEELLLKIQQFKEDKESCFACVKCYTNIRKRDHRFVTEVYDKLIVAEQDPMEEHVVEIGGSWLYCFVASIFLRNFMTFSLRDYFNEDTAERRLYWKLRWYFLRPKKCDPAKGGKIFMYRSAEQTSSSVLSMFESTKRRPEADEFFVLQMGPIYIIVVHNENDMNVDWWDDDHRVQCTKRKYSFSIDLDDRNELPELLQDAIQGKVDQDAGLGEDAQEGDSDGADFANAMIGI